MAIAAFGTWWIGAFKAACQACLLFLDQNWGDPQKENDLCKRWPDLTISLTEDAS
jgi:hypothetical protein